ncbi:4-carboxy-4-hydroxy-2-oxoadipate aldolase/oxaloacetate decarboxylase [Luteibacter aegosomaticola]|uniref:4-carboxy-4-hydroxy-2-oxoadipate aldolase/oxaloacetate decarboxylase n=1 Tax=Luteibacter aegosomaticola TaxID=2911538 RepID=UPI001FFAA240|nr:4-carboxy-4-hydroxy-2-oxoadipate aldolase/oxaloacetate decarboxylase [Luteibacter aegosomaticola]UPG92292.1 4-carboxy-4-hydroxy-2-oxoadipate aldolase/oxaloacetate decarboxylase [Luteibacter aegosomaticola]
MGVVVRNRPSITPEQADTLASMGVATVHEAQGRVGLFLPPITPIQQDRAIAGSAVTVLAQPGDNWMLHVAVEQCRPGDVLVVACTTENTDGMFGDLLATSLMARGVVGLVIDAGVRDSAELRRMGFPVWAKAVHARGTVKATLGSVNVPVVIGGQLVKAGDAIVADDDGVVVVPHASVERAIAASRKRVLNEEAKRERLAAGELGLDIYEMRPRLAEAGLRYVDDLPNE